MSSQDMAYRCAWMLLHDQEFADNNRAAPLAVWPRGSLRYLVDCSRRIWHSYKKPLSLPVVESLVYADDALLRRHGANTAHVVDAYKALDAFAVDVHDLLVMRSLARTWLEDAVLKLAVDRAKDAVAKGDRDKARELLEWSTLPPVQSAASVRLNATTPDFLKSAPAVAPGAIPTGFPELDAKWGGGYRPGEIGMLVAPTGVGKSMMQAFMTAHAMMAGKHVLYDTHELTDEQVQERVALALLRKGKRSVTDTWDNEISWAMTSRGVAHLGSAEIFPGYQTWADLDAGLEQYKREHGYYPDVLMLDSADDIAPYGKFEKEYQSLRAAYQHLRDMAHQLNIAVWSTGQLNRESVERARARLKDIGDSFGKAQKSHYVLGLAQTEAEKKDLAGAKANIYVLKDSLHGTTSAHLQVAVRYGNGDNGYPDFRINTASFP